MKDIDVVNGAGKVEKVLWFCDVEDWFLVYRSLGE